MICRSLNECQNLVKEYKKVIESIWRCRIIESGVTIYMTYTFYQRVDIWAESWVTARAQIFYKGRWLE